MEVQRGEYPDRPLEEIRIDLTVPYAILISEDFQEKKSLLLGDVLAQCDRESSPILDEGLEPFWVLGDGTSFQYGKR